MAELHMLLLQHDVQGAHALLGRILSRDPSVMHLDVNTPNVKGQTLLHVCALLGLDSLVKTIVQAGTVVDTKDEEGLTAFLSACQYGHYGVVRALVECGANTSSSSREGLTGLHYASLNGYLNIVQYLVSGQYIRPDVLDSSDDLPVHLAACNGHADIIQYLHSAGSNVVGQTKRGNTPLHVAVLKNQKEAVQTLLRLGAIDSATNSSGQTALDIALASGNHEIAALLDVPRPTTRQFTPPAPIMTVPNPQLQSTIQSQSGSAPLLDKKNKLNFTSLVCSREIMIHSKVRREEIDGVSYYNMYLETSGSGNDIPLLSSKKQSSFGPVSTTHEVQLLEENGKAPTGAAIARVLGSSSHMSYTVVGLGGFSTPGASTQELGHVKFLEKHPRDMMFLVPTPTGDQVPLVQSASDSGSKSKSRLFESYRQSGGPGQIRPVSLRTKKPTWDEELHGFVLEFYGRVTQRSSKNMQLVVEKAEGLPDAEDEKPVFIFGRTSENEFTLDFSWPLTAIQAFGVAIAAFDTY
eukprot:TRINITY_DN3637_c0_g1_i1.p1 TRINITY_DN3637_c0_g1~~TRINITY_DN3637_c0_g1_i1.p1  ORF type:complete len:522 (-),score=104.37 TRINITY_DN3637_c0_g1_i1:238-1803(-)